MPEYKKQRRSISQKNIKIKLGLGSGRTSHTHTTKWCKTNAMVKRAKGRWARRLGPTIINQTEIK